MNIYEKLLEVRRELDYLQKDTKGFNYKYVSGVSILSKIQNKMNDLGLLLYPEITEQSTDTINVLKKNGGQKTEIIVKSLGFYVWCDSESGETLKVGWSFTGQQGDASQAFGSGLTYSERYFLMKFFNVPTDEADPDKIRSNQQAKEHKEEGMSLEKLSNKIDDAFTILEYSESDENQMREEYIPEGAEMTDYEILLKKLINEYKTKQMKEKK